MRDDEDTKHAPNPLIPQRRVLLLTRRIQDLEHVRLSIDHRVLSVRVLCGECEVSALYRRDEEGRAGRWMG